MRKSIFLTVAAALMMAVLFTACPSDDPATGSNPVVLSISVEPDNVTMYKGQTQLFQANPVVQNNASKAVTWSIPSAHVSGTSISTSGVLTINSGESAASITVRATSAATGYTHIYGEATVTVSSEANPEDILTAGKKYRINSWDSTSVNGSNNVLRDVNGVLKIGPASDPHNVWIVMTDGTQKALKNESTGRYISVKNSPEPFEDAIPQCLSFENTEHFYWTFDETANPTQIVCRGAKLDHFRTLSNQDHDGVADQVSWIPSEWNAEWGTQKWHFQEVSESGPEPDAGLTAGKLYRIEGRYNGGSATGSNVFLRDGGSGYLEIGAIGEDSIQATKSIWIVMDNNGKKAIKNYYTGNYINAKGLSPSWNTRALCSGFEDLPSFYWEFDAASGGNITNDGAQLSYETVTGNEAEKTHVHWRNDIPTYGSSNWTFWENDGSGL